MDKKIFVCDFALIEAGISKPGEMDNLAQMIQPDYGILTSLKLSHKDHFGSLDEMIHEQIKLFKHVKQTIISSTIQLSSFQPALIDVLMKKLRPLNLSYMCH